MKKINKKIKLIKKEKNNYLILEGIKIIQKRNSLINYINGVLRNKELFDKDDLIEIIKIIKEKMEENK